MFTVWARINSLPNDTFFWMSKFKTNADDKFGVADMMEFVFERVENVGKGEDAGYQLVTFPTMFSKGFLP